MLPCLSKRVFGIECPGCGFQRSIHLLFHGEFVAAFKMYPAIYPIFALLTFLLINSFNKIKFANQITITLGIMSAAFILINFLIKLLFHS
ncbi:MAG: DUF2752 domain-containing protein [Flavobacteriaceae bacterium]